MRVELYMRYNEFYSKIAIKNRVGTRINLFFIYSV